MNSGSPVETHLEPDEKRRALLEAMRLRSRKSYLKNKEKVLRRTRERQKANRVLINQQARERNKRNYAHYLSVSRSWQSRNREKLRLNNRNWYHNHLEEQRERCRATRRKEMLENPEAVRERNRKWFRENPAIIKSNSKKRNALLRKSARNVKLISRWMVMCRKKRGIRCYYCGKPIFGNNIRFDHIVPISRGGVHAIENLCCTCNPCNASKHCRFVSEWIKVGQLIFDI